MHCATKIVATFALLFASGAAAQFAPLGDDPKMEELLARPVPSPTKLSIVCNQTCASVITGDAAKAPWETLFSCLKPGQATDQKMTFETLCGNGANLAEDETAKALIDSGEICRDPSCVPTGDYEMCRCDGDGCKRQVLTCAATGCTEKLAASVVDACTCNEELNLKCASDDVECYVEVERRLGPNGDAASGQCSATATSLKASRARASIQCVYGMPSCKRTEEAPPAPTDALPDAVPVSRED